MHHPGVGVLAPCLAWHLPHDLELVAVGVAAVERLAHAVVAGAAERPGLGERLCRGGEVLDRPDLPRQVVEAHRAARRARSRGADLEQAEVVMIATARRAHEGGAHPLRALELLEAEDPVVELRRLVGVADPEDGVVESGDVEHRLLLSRPNSRSAC